MYSKILQIMLAVLIPLAVFAEDARWSTYSVEDGLPVESVSAVAADKYGNIVAGFGDNLSGIARYDRISRQISVIPSELADCHVREIEIDSSGAVWCVTTENKLQKYQDSDWSEIPLDDNFGDAVISGSVLDRRGYLWLATDRGAWCFTGESWQRYGAGDGLATDRVNSITCDSNGILWCATDSCIAVFAETAWIGLTTLDGLPAGPYIKMTAGDNGEIWVSTERENVFRIGGQKIDTYEITWRSGLPSGEVYCMVADTDGGLWLGGNYTFGERGKGYTHFDGQNWRAYTYPGNGVHHTVMDAARDSLGNLWFATDGSGLRKLGEVDGWLTLDESDGLPGSSLSNLVLDNNGNLWASVLHQGLALIENGNILSIRAQENGLLSDNIYALAVDSLNQLWCGTDKGLQVFDGNSWETLIEQLDYSDIFDLENPEDTLQFVQTMDLSIIVDLYVDSKNNVWIGTYGGLIRYTGDQTQLYQSGTSGLANNRVYAITEDSEGNMWFGSMFGHLSKFDGQSWQSWVYQDSSTQHAVRSMIADRYGKVYAATFNDGVLKFDGSAWVPIEDQPVDWPTDMAFDSLGTLWVASSHGLCNWNGQIWTTITQNDGLLSNRVYSLVTDHSGNLWIATEKGLMSMNSETQFKLVDSPVPNGKEYLDGRRVSLPQAYSLEQNCPNPFNPSTSISYSIPESLYPSRVTLKVFNLRGQLVTTLVDGFKASGRYNLAWDGKENTGRTVASGIYFYRLTAGDICLTRKMVLLK